MNGFLIAAIIVFSALILSIIGDILVFKISDDQEESPWFAVLSAVSLLSFVMSCIFIPMGILGQIEREKSYKVLLHEIISVRYSEASEGRFFLGCGTVSDNLYYYYCYQANYGIYQDKVLASRTYIVEDDSVTPSLYKEKESGYDECHYVLYIPVGTVKVYYNVN